ncbi:MAG TPA: energy transducer TonB [Acidobacteriota bacterium]|nr:energy transducer TonB [Acidobacteriota bacterium]
MFDQLLESSCAQREKSRPGGFVVSLLAHIVIFALVLAVPVIFYQGLPGAELVAFLAPPPRIHTGPPPSAAAPPPEPSEPRPSEMTVLKPDAFIVPTLIPDEIPPPQDELGLLPSNYLRGPVPSGVPQNFGPLLGGTPGGGPSRVIGEPPPPPSPPKEVRKEPVRVGGDVLASRVIKRVHPIYPPLARRARIQGVVDIKVIVDEQGNVTQAELLDGHRMLADAALEAVRQWKYSPTILNGQPVPVVATISIRFRLDR